MNEKNDAFENLQIQMEIDRFRQSLPFLIENLTLTAKVQKARYDSLLQEGFTEVQALKIVIHKPLNEI